MYPFSCPHCQKPLLQEKQACRCSNNHSFDLGKSGYVNLLLPNQKNSKLPGDNKLMVAARQAFLDQGYYQPLSDCVNRKICALPLPPKAVLFDAGCGEGYYTGRLFEALTAAQKSFSLLGADISKFALEKAGKRCKAISYAVASLFRIPLPNASTDLLLNIFAPYCGDEFLRVLKPNGFMVLVIPGDAHLWELKSLVYEEPYKNAVKDYELDGFVLKDRQTVDERILLACPQDIDNLFKMTPYYYKTSAQSYQKIAALQTLETRILFEVLVYQKK